MRVAILCLGSQGDIRPFVALGVALKADGHEVVIAANLPNDKLCMENGLDFVLLAGDLATVLNAKKSEVGLGKVEASRKLIQFLKNALKEQFETLNKELRSVDAVFYHPAVFAAEHLIEALGLPSVRIHFQPDIPTRHYPCCIFPPGMPFKSWSNLASHFIAAQLFWLPLRGTINQWRTEVLGLPKLGLVSPAKHPPFQRIPKIIAVSKTLIPPAPDWPHNVHVTGYLGLSKADHWIATPVLQRFLDAGRPPIYIGFGSLTERCDERMTLDIIASLQKLQTRAILCGAFTHLQKEQLPESILWIDSAPHDWLFSRVSVVVHHGGSGTTHAALLAGKPSLVVPFILDQFHWGAAILERGVGPRPLPAKKFTQKAFQKSLEELIHTPSYATRAAAVSAEMQNEQGIRRALEILYETASYTAPT